MSQVVIGTVGTLRLAEALREVPSDVRGELQKEMRGVGAQVLGTARANASWSSRIPRALTLRTTFGRTAGVQIVARSAVAPHARVLEGITGNSTFRHPVFGDTDWWVTQATRPYLVDAVLGHRDEVVRAAEAAIEAAYQRSRLT